MATSSLIVDPRQITLKSFDLGFGKYIKIDEQKDHFSPSLFQIYPLLLLDK